MRTLLIGATGQIGAGLLPVLGDLLHNVRVLVRNRARLGRSQAIEVLERSPFTAEVFREALDGIDHVIYGVGRPEQFLFDPSTFRRVNYGLLRRFLSVLVDSSCPWLTYISTYEVFQEKGDTIRESHPVVENTGGMTPYVTAMTEAYRAGRVISESPGVHVTTIHPGAVYGGRNTGQGVTDYIENLLETRRWRVPFIIKSRFPVVHMDSLARATVDAFGHSGSFIISDQMTSLREIARILHRLTGSYVPPVAPRWMAERGAALLEQLAQLTRTPPIMSTAQVRFLTKETEPVPEKATGALDWNPVPLREGLRQYVESRPV